MKNLLLFGLAITVLIALFGDGGLEVSPTVSPSLEFSPALEFKPNVSYAPDLLFVGGAALEGRL